MAATSPAPNSPSPPAAAPPSPSIASTPPQATSSPPLSSPPLSSTSPGAIAPSTLTPSLPNATPPDPATPSTPPKSPPSPPPPVPIASPPTTTATPPPKTPVASPPPPTSPPPVSSLPPSPSPPTPPPPASPSNPPPPPPSDPPASPPTPSPPASSTPPPSSPPSPSPPANSPPPPSRTPPLTPAKPPINSSPPPPATPPPPAKPIAPIPSTSPPPSTRTPPPPPTRTPTPPATEPTPSPSNSIPTTPPPPVIKLAPPPPLITPPSSVNNATPPNALDSSNSSSNGGIGTGVIVGVAVAVGILILSLVGLAVWCMRRRRNDASRLNIGYVMPSPLGSTPRSDSTFTMKTQSTTAPLIASGSSSDLVYSPPGSGLGNSRSWFTFEELAKATNGFSSQNLLGEGGFGSVYKGYLPDGREIAVKQLKIGGGQGEREFKAEVEIISRIHHRHLVSLVGYCISEKRRLLVYDYVPNNNLHFHLHGEGRPVLDWATRVKIASGAARGIAYLHEDCNPRIIHRDIKSSNILLDNNFEAKVSDFGLAKLSLDANTHISTRVMGTFGYVAPEYASSGKLTEKSDVFSYGVVLLELVTGRKPVDASQPLGDESLVEWARPLLSHAIEEEEFEDLVDPKLGKNYIEVEMMQMIEAAAACVRHSAAKRPRMSQVVRAFDSLATADIYNGMRVGESEVYNSAQQSEQIRWFRRMAFGSGNFSTDFFSQGSLDGHEDTINTVRGESDV